MGRQQSKEGPGRLHTLAKGRLLFNIVADADFVADKVVGLMYYFAINYYYHRFSVEINLLEYLV